MPPSILASHRLQGEFEFHLVADGSKDTTRKGAKGPRYERKATAELQ